MRVKDLGDLCSVNVHYGRAITTGSAENAVALGMELSGLIDEATGKVTLHCVLSIDGGTNGLERVWVVEHRTSTSAAATVCLDLVDMLDVSSPRSVQVGGLMGGSIERLMRAMPLGDELTSRVRGLIDHAVFIRTGKLMPVGRRVVRAAISQQRIRA